MENLPEPVEETIFIVSRLVARASSGRDDLVFPVDLIRGAKGKVIGCRSLGQGIADADTGVKCSQEDMKLYVLTADNRKKAPDIAKFYALSDEEALRISQERLDFMILRSTKPEQLVEWRLVAEVGEGAVFDANFITPVDLSTIKFKTA